MTFPGFRRQGILFVVSAPSGTGKSTLCKSLRLTQDVVYSVSCTTRSPRPGEVDGVDYHFISQETFKEKIDQGEMLEFARVVENYYGTLKANVKEALLAGQDVLMDIDVQGAESIRRCDDEVIEQSLVDVFIIPPTLDELENRLRNRGTEQEDEIRRRLSLGKDEMKLWPGYKYTLISGSMKEDFENFSNLMTTERFLSNRLTLNGAADA
ncbi:MAG: guanylate kinase [Verrucomicrobiota bacterium]